MVPAQKKQPAPDSVIETPGQSAPNGFVKVLSSIQGLQQRLEDFSLEEASQAEGKAHALTQKLKELQAQLALVEKLRDASVGINRHVESIPQADFDSIAPGGLDSHPQLRAIIQAGKLIRMHRLLQAARASAESVSFDFIAPEQTSTASARDSGDRANTCTDFVIQTGANGAVARETAPSSPLASSISAANGVLLVPDLTAESEPRSAASGPADAQPVKSPPAYDFAALKLDEFPTQVGGRKEAAEAETNPAHEHAVTGKKAKIASNRSQFDERLLNDLIDTYGEFVVPKPAVKTTAPVQAVETSPTLNAALPRGPELIPEVIDVPAFSNVVLVPARAEPEPTRALPPPDEQDDPQTTVEAFVPSLKNHGEIDRQLKRIIKDYGEYDLYSHPKASKFNKTAAIAAFVVLGLVLGGFYLFKSPPAPTSGGAVNLTPAQSTSSPDPEPKNKNKQ